MLLCVASAALWARSYAAMDWVRYRHDLGASWEAGMDASWNSSWLVVRFSRTMWESRDGAELGWHWVHFAAVPISEEVVDPSSGSLGPQIRAPGLRVRWTRDVVAPGDVLWTFRVMVRLWIVFLLSAILPTLWLLRRRAARRRGRAPSRCRVCGYDLRASAGRCPECGTPITAAAKGNV